MRVFLSGMPELKLGLNDKALYEATGRSTKGKAVDLEDINSINALNWINLRTKE